MTQDPKKPMTPTEEPTKTSTAEQSDIDHMQSQAKHSYKKPKKPKKPIALIALIALFVLLILGILYGLLQSYSAPSPASSAPSSGGLFHAAKNKLASGGQIVTLQGEVDSETVNLSTKLPSRIEAIYVKEGQSIQQGTLLAKLISPEIIAKKEQADAMLQSALASQSLANRGTRQENIDSLYANWQGAKAQAMLAAETAARGEYLYQQGVISRQRRDEMQAAKISSEQLAEAAHQQYLKDKRGRSDEVISSADAQVQIAQAAVAEAAALDAETNLIAPIDGVINKIYAKPSELVAIAVPVISMIKPSDTVKLSVREDYLPYVQQASSLTGFIPALNRSVEFHISHIGAEGEFATIKTTRQTGGYDIKSFELKLKPAEPIEGLVAGMSVVFEIHIAD